MSFGGEPTRDQDQWHIDADEVQVTMQQIHDHHRVEMSRSQSVQDDGANCGRIAAPNIWEGSQVRLDARHVRTTGPTHKLD